VSFVLLSLTCLLLPAWPGWLRAVLRLLVVLGLLCAAMAWGEMWAKWGWGIHPRAQMERVMGLMANVNLHASFLALILPMNVCAALLLRGVWRGLAVLAAVALALMLVLMQTRAVYVGLAVAALPTLVLVWHYSARFGLSRRAGRMLVLAVAAVALAGAIFVAVVPAHPVADRVRTLLAGDRAFAAGARTVVWDATLRMAHDHLLAGVGAGNFGVQIHRYYDIHDPALQDVESNWLEPHNDFLWVLAEKGLPGLFCYVAVFAVAFFHLWRVIAGDGRRDAAIAALGTLFALLAYAVASFFDFPLSRPGHQAIVVFLLGMSVVLARTSSARTAERKPWPPAARGTALVVAAGLCLLAAIHAAAVLRQDWFVKIARQEMIDENWEELVAHARRARVPWSQLDALGVPVVFLEGLGHLLSARQAEATACFVEASRQSPYRDYLQHNAAVLLSTRGDHEGASQQFSAMAARSSNNPAARLAWAEESLRGGQAEQAIAILQRLPAGFEKERVQALLRQARRQSGAR